MRRCAGCGEPTDYFEAECRVCHYVDTAWDEAVSEPGTLNIVEAAKQLPLPSTAPTSSRVVVIPVSSFSDSAELAYELSRVHIIAKEAVGHGGLEIRFDFTQLGFDWEAVGVGEEHEFIPGSIGILAVTEACRALQFALQTWRRLKVSALLPPEGHPASMLLQEAGVLSALPRSNILWGQGGLPRLANRLDLETIVPFTGVGIATYGQLSDLFHTRFDVIADRGTIGKEYRSPLRQVVMDLAENAAQYGNGGYVGCFLRQEKGRAAGTKGRADMLAFNPRRHSHLFVNCFTLGPSLSEVTGHASEWAAAQAVLGGGFTSRATGGGSGMETIMRTVVDSATGTVYLNSRNYVRVVSPNGLVHEYTLGGDQYLPGVHICLLIPLAIVAQLHQRKSA